MKKITALLSAIILTVNVFGQAPQKMTYQAVIRNASNQLVTNQTIGMRISIRQDSNSGISVYAETQTPLSNANGLISIEIGGGVVLAGTISNIDWGSHTYWIKTETDPAGGVNYTIIGNSQLLSVPYALNSADNRWKSNGSDISNMNTGNVGIGTTLPTEKLEVLGGKILVADNEFQSLQQSSGIDVRMGAGTFGNGQGAVGTYSYHPFDIYTNGARAIRVDEIGNVGIGTTSPQAKLDIINSVSQIGIRVEPGALTTSEGILAKGNYIGITGQADYLGGGNRFGVSGIADGGSLNYGVIGGNVSCDPNLYYYGIYGDEPSSAHSWAVYSSGDFGCSGNKAAIVKTSGGPRELYCQESPENWFEDFGSSTIQNGECTVSLNADYLETVTVDAQHPIHAFITPNGNMGNWWIEYSGTTFIVKAPSSANGTAFDFRVVAKRKGHEDLRLRKRPGAYVDRLLYPTVDDVPAEFKSIWLDANKTNRIKTK